VTSERGASGAAERRGLRPGARIAGTFAPPSSKSIAQRALLAAALARGETRILGLGREQDLCDDVRAALGLVRGLGARVEAGAEGSRVVPAREAPGAELEVGESGTLARLATAVLALGAGPPPAYRVRLDGSGSLLTRGSAPLFACLRAAGARLVSEADGWPVAIIPAPAPPEMLRLETPVSSQEPSALLLALAARAEPGVLDVQGPIPSRPYLALTRAVLARFGAGVVEQPRGDATRFRVSGPLVAPSEPYAIEPDASAAAVALAAACIAGGELRVPGLTPASAQGDVRIAEHLARFGCRARLDEHGIFAAGRPTRGATLDLAGEPDLAPVLAAVAAAAALREPAARSELHGLATLQRKESRRIDVLSAALRRLGLAVEATPDSLAIAPGARATSGPLALDPRGDHRMAFAFALLGLARDGVEVLDPSCVAKSWPAFWRDLARLGA
jgi:3-phosphoshikimate 1-carboxyvinyltransferase